ncbi:bifunctional diguanylate cyclase/phosphodiesterase [Erythrobacter sp. QSSC1-22B]|uniref:putative bifunctional diguanylate cyclase/phosphodiesterase n=1 Tax=Erythrobacter sp. QSSC1-22B TaxID=1860125 RepID=UPI0011A3FB72|nr:EAL domain-containing protein [Erythrobacter sp. QSSC1-22B]
MTDKFSQAGRRERDVVALGIAAAAIILFVGTGGTVVPQLVSAWRGLAEQPDAMLSSALLLNIALILLGWNRYKSMNAELGDRRRSEEEARRLAQIDPLTGCYNRRSIAPAMAELLMAAESEGRALAIILVDLDNFKQVNDVNGHNTGDAVLTETSERMGDILPADALLARLGGDEFAAAVVYDPVMPGKVEHLASLLIERVAQPITVDDAVIEITMSVGIASSINLVNPVDADVSTRLIHKADIAMYQAKKQGKNRFFWFEPAMEQELRFRNELESGIRKGIAKGEFVPFYEQQIDLETGELVGFEMLARWLSPELGVVGPDIFIPIAEEIGVVAEMSENLMRQAFEDAKRWNPKLTMSVNISPVQMRDPWFAQKLLKLLLQHNFPPSRLEIEITESALHDNVGLVRSMITSLRNQGVRVSLDDFGTGYASLSQLRSLPFDRLKIDRSFIRELNGGGAAGPQLVDAIISMGNGLKMPITAEGIENEAVLEMLRKMGQLKGQGYHYGRPEPADEVLTRLHNSGLLSAVEAETADQPPQAIIGNRAI